MIPSVPFTGTSGFQAETKTTKPEDMGREEFTQLLIAQIKNQDPLEPMSSIEFMSQLTQLSNLEQLMAVKTKLDGLDSLEKSFKEAQALSHIGKEVVVTSSNLQVASGEVENLEYELGTPAKTVTVSIFDSVGRLVYTKSQENVAPGVHAVGWDGRDTDGNLLGDGTYLVQVRWSNGLDAPVAVPTQLRGVVEAVTHNALGEPLLKVGPRTVSLAAVMEVGAASQEQ